MSQYLSCLYYTLFLLFVKHRVPVTQPLIPPPPHNDVHEHVGDGTHHQPGEHIHHGVLLDEHGGHYDQRAVQRGAPPPRALLQPRRVPHGGDRRHDPKICTLGNTLVLVSME